MANVIEFTIKGIDQFSSTMKKATDGVESMGRAALSSAKYVAASALAIEGFVAIIGKGIENTDKFAKSIGATVGEVSKLEFAFDLANVSAEELQQMSIRLTKGAADAANGTGVARSALNQLNISAKEFSALSIDEKYNKLNTALTGVIDPAQKLRIATDLFGRGMGATALQVLNGSDAMQKAKKDAEFLGVAISEQAAANADAFGDSMDRAGASVKGVSRGIAGELMPVLTGLNNTFANVLAGMRGHIVEFTKQAITGFFTFIEVVKQVFDRFKQIFSGNSDALASLLKGIGSFAESGVKLFVIFTKSLPTLLYEAVKAAAMVFNDFGVWIGESLAKIALGEQITSFGDALAQSLTDRLGKAADAIGQELGAVIEEAKPIAIEGGQAIADAFGVNLTVAEEKAEEAMARLMEFGTVVKTQVEETAVQTSDLMTAINEQMSVFKDELMLFNEEFAKSLFTLANNTITSISNATAEAIVMGKSLSEAFKQIAQQVLTQIIAMFIKMQIQRFILAAMNKSAVASEASAEASKAVGLAGANMFASWAGAPWPLSIAAPAMAAGAIAGASAAFTAGASVGAGLGASVVGVSHGGLTNVPREGTFLLDKGERVLSRNQNSDLMDFMDDSGPSTPSGVINVSTMEIHILENATNVDALLRMDRREIDMLVAGPIIDSLNRLDKQGVRPQFSERQGNR